MEVDQAEDEKSEKEMYKWDDSATKLLLNLYQDATDNLFKLRLKSKQQLWVHIVEELSKYGIQVTPKQAQNRLLTLERSLKKRENDASHRNQLPTPCMFDDDIREIREKRRKNFNERNLFSVCQSLTDNETENNGFDENTNSIEVFSVLPSDLNRPPLILDTNKWDPDSTRLFIRFFTKTMTDKPLLRRLRTKTKVWEHIADQVNEHGYKFEGKQARNRLFTLMRAYKKCMERKSHGKHSSFMFDKEVREMLRHKVTIPSIKDLDDDDDDDWEMDDENSFEINFIDVHDSVIENIDNIDLPIESESADSQSPNSSHSPLPSAILCQSSSSSRQPSTTVHQLPTTVRQLSPDSLSSSYNYSILNELKLLRKDEGEFRQKMYKIEEEKLDLMRQNNILLKVLIDKLTNKS